MRVIRHTNADRKPPKIDDEQFQRFCFIGQYVPPLNKPLSSWERVVYGALLKFDGNNQAVADHLGHTLKRVCDISKVIRNKGWEVPGCQK